MTPHADEPVLEDLSRKLSFVEKGMLGFESLLHYELTAYDTNTPFYWLRSTEEPDVAFIVMEPALLVDDYAFDLGDEDMNLLKVANEADIFVLVVCTIPEDPMDMTANLLGPLVFHRTSNLGRQLILDRHKYPVRYPVFQEQADDTAVEAAAAEAEAP